MEKTNNAILTLKKALKTKFQKVIVALSGGVDSMVLTHILIKNNFNICLVHFNHQKRLESNFEATKISEFAKINKLDLEYFVVPKKDNVNFQSHAHNFRTKKLIEVAEKYETNIILTAHHLNDLLESFLINFIKGKDLTKLNGFNFVNETKGFKFFKPLYNVSKDEIINYAKSNNIKYYEDYSNYELDYLRNRIRLNIIPVMLSENENILNQALSYSNDFNNLNNLLEQLANNYLKLHNNFEYNLDNFLKLNSLVRNKIIQIILENLKINYSKNLILKLDNLLSNQNKPNIILKLNSNYNFIKTYHKFMVSKDNFKLENIKVQLPENKKINNIIYSKKILFKEVLNKKFGIITYEDNQIKFPLYLISDYSNIKLEFNYGKKMVKRFFIESKIPLDLRNNFLIVDSNQRPLWIPNVYLNKKLKGKNKLYFKLDE